jgi:hypothetical protein
MHELSRSNSSSSEDDIDFFYGRGRDGGGSRHNDVGGKLSRGNGGYGGHGEDSGEYAEYADAGSYLGGSVGVGPSRRRARSGDRVGGSGSGGTGGGARPRWSLLHSEPPSALLSRNTYNDMVLRRRMPGMHGVGGRRALLSQSMPIARAGGASRGAVRSRPLPYTGRKPHPSLRR